MSWGSIFGQRIPGRTPQIKPTCTASTTPRVHTVHCYTVLILPHLEYIRYTFILYCIHHTQSTYSSLLYCTEIHHIQSTYGTLLYCTASTTPRGHTVHCYIVLHLPHLEYTQYTAILYCIHYTQSTYSSLLYCTASTTPIVHTVHCYNVLYCNAKLYTHTQLQSISSNSNCSYQLYPLIPTLLTNSSL